MILTNQTEFTSKCFVYLKSISVKQETNMVNFESENITKLH